MCFHFLLIPDIRADNAMVLCVEKIRNIWYNEKEFCWGDVHLKKFSVFSGFLGSGKTTAMMALTRYFGEHYGKAAMISNDLGGQGLADNRYAQLRGCNASELTGDCICYQTENLVSRLNQLFDNDGCQLVISDIPGFGVGALEHVYHTLNEQFPGQFDLAPFTVLVEPRTVDLLCENQGGDAAYILNSQLMEADLIVLNKCDLLNKPTQERAVNYLCTNYPHANVISISAKTGEGLDDLCRALSAGSASMHRPDIGYGGECFSATMSKLCEFNMQFYATVCCNDFDGNAYLAALAEGVRTALQGVGTEIPHLKLLAWKAEGEYGRVDLLGGDRPIEVNQLFESPCTELAVVLNSSLICPADDLERIITERIESVSEQYQLTLMVYKKEYI